MLTLDSSGRNLVIFGSGAPLNPTIYQEHRAMLYEHGSHPLYLWLRIRSVVEIRQNNSELTFSFNLCWDLLCGQHWRCKSEKDRHVSDLHKSYHLVRCIVACRGLVRNWVYMYLNDNII